ncbi:MAG: transcriptional regulator, TetR family [Myxococcaceae bacterium]|nr:transcriptional regulator, TetR family [Myxococcaceae bacterium]
MSHERQDQRLVRGSETRQRILARAVDIASSLGLEGLSIGDLAGELGMSKAGVFAHFGSKEELQLATMNAAREIFVLKNAAKVFTAKAGIPRVWTLCQSLLDYLATDTFRGGCFFAAASSEYDDRPGAVRDRLVEIMREWLSILSSILGEAKTVGDLSADSDPEQLAFELHALQAGANWARKLLGDQHALERARTAMLSRLESSATTKGKRLLRGLLAR